MTSYITINNTEIDPDSPITADLMTKLRDNPIAMAEGASGSPLNIAGWQPYDYLSGGTGIIYSNAVSGNVASFESPAFADDYDYMFIFETVSLTSASPAALAVAMYRETSAAYSSAGNFFTGPTSAVNTTSGYANIFYPRKTSRSHLINGYVVEDAANSTTVGVSCNVAVNHTTAQKIGKVRFSASTGSIDGGIVYMYRRRVRY